jgi:Exopolysaccharide biosynthesis protein related to N-acetylglucosamine-1-phosphodiester alpha-N-acetylglucosaminidase
VTCTDQSEIVLFTPEFGARTPRSSGIEIVLDGSGRIIDRRPPGGRVPPEGRVLSAIGDAARWLTTHAARGSRVTVEEQVLDQDDRPVDLGDGDVVNGGPWLVRAGRVYLDVEPDGIYHPDDPSFLYTWGIRRNPRTMLGVDASGRVIVVTADGRRPGYSDGLSLLEGARLMRDLGAVSAINLDGGGSVTLAVRGVLDNRPSDAGGERAVGDALLFVPAR